MRLLRKTLVKMPKGYDYQCIYCHNDIYGEHYSLAWVSENGFGYGRSHIGCVRDETEEERQSDIRKTKNKRLVNDWNELYDVGIEVYIVNDNGSVGKSYTKSKAWLLGDSTPVCGVNGISGGYLLTRLTPVKENEK